MRIREGLIFFSNNHEKSYLNILKKQNLFSEFVTAHQRKDLMKKMATNASHATNTSVKKFIDEDETESEETDADIVEMLDSELKYI
jgi:hypothetical protein